MSSTLQVNGTARKSALLFAPIARDLEATERVFAAAVGSRRPAFARLLDHLNHYRGKRLRPVLLLLTGHSCGNVSGVHHKLAAVVEMVHTATLVHDDVLDEAGLRRHVTTVNAGWGNKASILLGDYLFTHAFHLAATTGDARACEIIGAATNRVCEGELHQTLERGNLTLSEDDYYDIIDGKTAALTACACHLGALFSEASDEVVERMTNYGRLLGQAFQVADDLLDLWGEEQTAGKTLGTDLEQQKLTLPLIHMLESVGDDEADRLRGLLRQPTPAARGVIRAKLMETDAVEYTRRRAEELADEAAAQLVCVAPSQYRDLLETLTRWAIRREA